MKDYSRNVNMICKVCGNDLFEFPTDDEMKLAEMPDETIIKCNCCGREVTKVQLIEDNQEVIQAGVKEISDDVIKDIKKQLKKAFK